jgi:hypothetical protein
MSRGQGWPGTRYEAKAIREGRTPAIWNSSAWPDVIRSLLAFESMAAVGAVPAA